MVNDSTGAPGPTGAFVKAAKAAMKVTEAIIASAEAFESESGGEMVVSGGVFENKVSFISLFLARGRQLFKACYVYASLLLLLVTEKIRKIMARCYVAVWLAGCDKPGL